MKQMTVFEAVADICSNTHPRINIWPFSLVTVMALAVSLSLLP